MAEEIQQEEGAPKKKLPIMLILAVVGIVLLVVLTVVGTLAVTGFFSKPEQDSVEALLKKAEAEKAKAAEGDGHGGGGKDDGHGGKDGHGGGAKAAPGGPEKLQRGAPEAKQYDSRYKELSRPLVSNLSGSKKVMQVTVAIMTHYDDTVIKNIEKHEFALRAAALDVIRLTTDSEVDKPIFRIELAEKVRLAMNAVLERYEGFGGIEQVLFTEFVVQ
ncbi:MAG: hypothetical protein EBQ76_07045 [Betaproteobacteria bacterium]|nr:hypothetical protein [Betaproteobacteria bacterium]NBY14473.1 hypothetical protein [Betaproteobacteria bacterium]